jgi:hypothetical protein
VKKAKGNPNKKTKNIEINLKPIYDLREMVEWRGFEIMFVNNIKIKLGQLSEIVPLIKLLSFLLIIVKNP